MELPQNIVLKSFPVGPLGCNCTIIGDKTSKQAMVIDPGGDANRILSYLKELDLTVIRILHTHAHLDHFLASGKMKEATGSSLALHKEDAFLWDQLEMQCRLFGIPYEPVPAPDQWLEHDEELHIPSFQGKCLHTPGHTPGSMCFSFEGLKLLIAGDTLFQGSIGRTDLWGGDFKKIARSIKDQLYVLDEETHVVTGHGSSTTIGFEVRYNPFVKG
ncbi:MAG: MBL fold metallo-hydrolase [SAR324 cluster bacterium]|nr:MBL fold metallo-hydrolase [SAR324 cluster bacterium]